MMRFRRKRSFRRTRRAGPETYTIVDCFGCRNVYQDMPCISPLVDSIELMSMRTPRIPPASDSTEVSNPSDKAVIVEGIKFQMEYAFDPSETQSNISCDPQTFGLNFNLRIWEAIVVVPLAQGTAAVPAYVPILTSANFQVGDIADRVLWKRISYVPIFAFNGGSPQQQLEFTARDVGHGPVAVKSRVRLDDRHMLLYVWNYTHDLAGLGNPGDETCIFGPTINPCVIPVQHDGWFKIFYRTRK